MNLPYVDSGTHLFRFMNPRTNHFWSAITDMLGTQQLFLNSRTKFNDPYDSQPEIVDDVSAAAIRSRAARMFSAPFRQWRDALDVAKILELQAQGKTYLNRKQIKNIKAGIKKSAAEFLDECGLCSFSLVADDPLLWAHYAGAFSGLCVVFRRGPSMQGALCLCSRVSHVEQRPRFLLVYFSKWTDHKEEAPNTTKRPIKSSFFHFCIRASSGSMSKKRESTILLARRRRLPLSERN